MQKTEPRIGIMSRTHNADLTSALIVGDWKHVVLPCGEDRGYAKVARIEPHALTVEMNPRYLMSEHSRAWIDPRATYEVATSDGQRFQGMQAFVEYRAIEQLTPWLDGARECLLTLATWLEGL